MNRILLVFWGFLALSVVSPGAVRAAEPPDRFEGKTLVETLRSLEQQGLVLLYSSAVVSPELVVPIEPTATSPRAILEEILASLDLATREGPGGALLIVPRRQTPDVTVQPRDPAHEIQFVTEVVVTPSRHSVMRKEQAASREMRQEDLALAAAPGGDVSSAVQRLPGVTAADQTAALHVRGSTTADVAMILDGLELYDPYHLQSFQSPFSLVDDSTVDRIDFFGGGFTADRGDRNGGFIDISTRAPSASGRGELQLGSMNSRLLLRSAKPRKGIGWMASVRTWYPQLLVDTAQIGGGDDTKPRFSDAYAKVTVQRAPNRLWSFHSLLSFDRLEFKEPPVPTDEAEQALALTRNGYLWGRLIQVWSPAVTSESVLSLGRIDRGRSGISQPDDRRSLVDDRREVNFYGLKHDTAWQLSDDRGVRAGVDIRRLNASYRYSQEFTDDPGGARTFSFDPRGTSFGAYASYRTRLTATAVLEVGIRYDRQTHTKDRQWSPRANAIWQVGPNTEFRLGAGRYYQSQRIHELRVEDGETRFRGAEASDGVEVTFRHGFRRGPTLRIDGYYRNQSSLRVRYENLFQPIEWFPETGEDRVRIEPQSARLRGIETLLSSRPDRKLTWWLGYTRSAAEDRVEGFTVPRSWDQPHAAKGLIGYRGDTGWTASLSGSWHTGWPTTAAVGVSSTTVDGETELEPILGDRNADRFGDYFRLDAKASRRFPLARGGAVVLTLELLNLTDRNNQCCLDEFIVDEDAGPPYSVQSIYDSWLGATPSFNVLWEF